MKIYLTRPESLPRFNLGLIFPGIALILIAVVRLLKWVSLEFFQTERITFLFCHFRNIFGIPCLTCGMTRSLFHFSHFRIFESFQMNPLIFLSVLLLLGWGIYSLAVRFLDFPQIKIEFKSVERKLLIVFIIAAILLNWYYLIFIGKV